MTTVYDCQLIEKSPNILESEVQADPPNELVPNSWDVVRADGCRSRYGQQKVVGADNTPTDDDMVTNIVGDPITSINIKERGGAVTTYTTDSAP